MKRQPPFGASDPDEPYVDYNAGVTSGSKVPAGFMNWTQAEILDVIEAAGFTPDDVLQLAPAIQSSRLNYAVAGGTGNAQTATLSPVPLTIPDGMELCLKITTPNPGAATLNVNALGAVSVVRSDGSPLVGGELTGLVELRYTGTVWQIMSVSASARLVLTADATFYVNASTGNDSNAGTLAAPFLTLQHAWNFVQQELDLGGKNVTISCAGAFTAGVVASGGCIGASSPTAVTFQGTGGATVATAGAACFAAQFGASFRLSGFTLSASSGASTLVCAQGQVTIGASMVFGASAAAHISVTSSGVVIATNNYSITGGAPAHYQVALGYVFLNAGVVVTLTGTPAFGNAFAVFFQLGLFGVGSGVSFSGAATGFRYSVALNGVINTNGGGANFFPGSGAGSAATGGQYA